MTEREDQRQPDSPLVSERGSTTLEDGVVSKLAGLAAGEVEGVRMGGSASRTAAGLFESVTGSQSQTRGISAEVGRAETAIDLTMGIEYGRDILELVGRVRDRITERVENLTGLRVTELNVTISDIIFPDDERDGEDERRQRRRQLKSGAGQEDRPQERQTEELRTAGRERGAEDTKRVDLGAARTEAMTQSGRRFSEETPRAEDRDEEEVRVEGRPLDEDETRELRIGDGEIDETRQIPGEEDETGREGERRRDRRRDT